MLSPFGGHCRVKKKNLHQAKHCWNRASCTLVSKSFVYRSYKGAAVDDRSKSQGLWLDAENGSGPLEPSPLGLASRRGRMTCPQPPALARTFLIFKPSLKPNKHLRWSGRVVKALCCTYLLRRSSSILLLTTYTVGYHLIPQARSGKPREFESRLHQHNLFLLTFAIHVGRSAGGLRYV